MLFATPRLTDQDETVIEAVNQLREQLSYATSDAKRWEGLLRRDAFARAIRGSNTIEGYNVTVDDAVAAAEDDEPLDADEETWDAIIGYRDALTYIMQLSDDPYFQHNEALIRSLHFMMLKYDLPKHPGQWRPGPIRVVDERKNKVVYVGPDEAKVPSLVHELVESLNAADNSPVMVRAAMAHLNLTMIHPFSDGNGRMARALQTLVLAREGILSPTFCSIEEYLGRHQDEYYDVLAKVGAGSWHPERDASKWIQFCLTAHYRCAHNLLRRTREIGFLWDEIEKEVEKIDMPKRVEYPLVMAAIGWRLRNSIYRRTAEVSEQIASRELKKLTDYGLLEARGERRGRIYVRSKKLTAIRRSTQEKPHEVDPYETPEEIEPRLPGID